MKTTVGKLRNITTGILHTKMEDIHLFFEEFVGEKGLMTHHLPSAQQAILPTLKTRLPQEWFEPIWLKEGLDAEVEIQDIAPDEISIFWDDFNQHNDAVWEALSKKNLYQ